MTETIGKFLSFLPLGYLKLFPLEIALLIGAIFVLISFQLKNRRVDIEDITTINKAQVAQIAAFISLISDLNEEIIKLRQQLKESHEAMDEMRNRINTLEDLLRSYERKERSSSRSVEEYSNETKDDIV